MGQFSATLNSGEEKEKVRYCYEYSPAPHNDISVNDGPHIRRWSHKIIIITSSWFYYKNFRYK